MPDANIISIECRDSPIEKVVVFNDRAEVKRLIKTTLNQGTNEVHINNVSLRTVHDSVRVDGRGDATIQDVTTQDLYGIPDELQTPELKELREAVKTEERNVNTIKNQIHTLTKKSEMFEKLTEQIGKDALPKDMSIAIDENVLGNVTAMLDYYTTNTLAITTDKRSWEESLREANEKFEKAQREYEAKKHSTDSGMSKKFIVTLDSATGGAVELDLVYQVYNASWRPSYDLRVEAGAENKMKITYYGKISQTTGESWNDTQIILSTAIPCLGGQIPELGTLEAVLASTVAPPPVGRFSNFGGARTMMKSCAVPASIQAECLALDAAPIQYDLAEATEQALSTEFTIVRKTTVPSGNDEQRVTIGIVDTNPQLIHESVPSKNSSVFLTASAINDSKFVFLAGEASVYLNNSFVAKTHLKNVSANERFSVSLGVDAAIKVEYRPAKKYHEQIGIINKSSANATEQVINVKNTRKDPILLTIKENLPRSTDEKIKIKLVSPTVTAHEEQLTSTNSIPVAPHEGCLLNSKNNLEWTVALAGGQIQDLLIKWTMDHPKEEKIVFREKY
ncbi:unnamed protein product [Auanema sp. JU1783]|nr:unnamed protein product [Auanema sp. JU1783]